MGRPVEAVNAGVPSAPRSPSGPPGSLRPETGPSTPASGDRRAHRDPRRNPGGPSTGRLVAGYVALIAIVGAAITAVGGLGAVASAQEAPSSAGVTVAGRGEELFLTTCASCHGPQGQGGPGGPDIRQAGAALADFVLRTGRMPLADPNAPAAERAAAVRRAGYPGARRVRRIAGQRARDPERGRERCRRQPRPPAVRGELLGVSRAGGWRRRGRRRLRGPGAHRGRSDHRRARR